MMRSSPAGRRSVRVGGIDIDDLTLTETLDAVVALVEAGQGGTVLTPNVDHVVLARDEPRLRDAYASASLSLVDGMPLLWASRLLGEPLREKVSGSDLVLPLMQLAAKRGYRVYFLGGEPTVADRAAARLRDAAPGLIIAGTDCSRIDIDREWSPSDEVIARVHAARPDILLVALGCPKQEIFMHLTAPMLRPAVMFGIGASLDFWAGTARRAPAWVSARGLEWLYRLLQEPRRLWRRYLVRDPAFLVILLRDLLSRIAERRRAATT